MIMRMHAIVFEAVATNTQNDLPGILWRPHVCPPLIKWQPRGQRWHQMISVGPLLLAAIPSPTPAQPLVGTHERLRQARSATGYHSEALRNARHVVQHDAQEEDQDAGHKDHSAHPGPGGAFRRAPPVWLLLHRLLGRPPLQGLLFPGDRHHRDGLLLAPGQQAAAQVSGQQRSLLGDGQGQHVAPIAGKFDEDRGVLGRVRDGDDRQDLGVVGELRHGEAWGQLGDAPAPRASHVLLARPHLLEAHRAAGVFAVQQLGPSPGAVVIETDLTFQQRILGERLHRGPVAGRPRPRPRPRPGGGACSQRPAGPRPPPSGLSTVAG